MAATKLQQAWRSRRNPPERWRHHSVSRHNSLTPCVTSRFERDSTAAKPAVTMLPDRSKPVSQRVTGVRVRLSHSAPRVSSSYIRVLL